MKKLVLTSLTCIFAMAGFAQFTITSTSLTFDGHTVPAGTSQGQFYSYQPNNGGGTFYSDNTCATAGAQGDGPTFTIGGFDPNVYDATAAAAPNTAPDGVIFYGGGIRRVYYGDPCVANDPSFGFHTGTASGGIGAGTDIDLSSAANQKIEFSYQSNVTLTLELQLFDASYTSKLTGATFTFNGDNMPHTETIDFSSFLQVGADLTNVRQVSFTYTSETKTSGFAISIADIKLGSSVTGLLKNQKSLITKSAIYPNPATSQVTFSVELEKAHEVKIIMTDLAGKQFAVIAEGTFSSIEKTMDVSNYPKGIYAVSYYIDGVPSRAELLIID